MTEEKFPYTDYARVIIGEYEQNPFGGCRQIPKILKELFVEATKQGVIFPDSEIKGIIRIILADVNINQKRLN